MFLFENAAHEAMDDFVKAGKVLYADIFGLATAASQWSADCAHLLGVEPALNGVTDIVVMHLREAARKFRAKMK